MLRRSASPAPAPAAWPSAEPVDGALRIEGRLVGGFELAPVNLELMAEGEREAALESLAALYDAVPRPFSLLSVPADRPPHEHLGAIEEHLAVAGRATWYRPYAALYRELSAAPRRPLRRAYLLLDAPSGPELERALGVVGRMAEEQGLAARQVPGDDLVALWADVARARRHLPAERRARRRPRTSWPPPPSGAAGRPRSRRAGSRRCWRCRASPPRRCASDRCRAPRRWPS